MVRTIAPYEAQFSLDELRYEVLRICRRTNTVDLIAAFRDLDDAQDFADEFVETEHFDPDIRDRGAKTSEPGNDALTELEDYIAKSGGVIVP
jgi:hypothetical protein